MSYYCALIVTSHQVIKVKKQKQMNVGKHVTFLLHREAQEFVDKFEGALGKGKGRKWYAYKVMMKKVRHKI